MNRVRKSHASGLNLRRFFLSHAALSRAALLGLLAVGSFIGQSQGAAVAHPAERALQRYEFSQPQMGVPFRIVLYAADPGSAQKAANAAFARIAQLNGIFSNYETDSELNRLSHSSDEDPGAPVRVSDELWFVLQRAQGLARRSGGAFDVTIGPVANLWRKARRTKELPDEKALAETRQAVGYEKLRLDRSGQSVRLLAKRMRLDLGGIAKGYAVDEAMKVLRAHGITRALVGGDGDIRLSDPPPGEVGWKIGVAGSDLGGAPKDESLLLSNRAISTSGDLAQYVEIGGRRYSHIVDPRTGLGLTDRSLVTVIAADSITADSLATAVCVLGMEKGKELVAAIRGVELRIVRKPDAELQVYQSAGFYPR